MKLGQLIIGAALWVAATSSVFAVTATGGNTTNVIDGYRIHTFTNSATASNFVVTAGGNVEVLVVAGGGGGGQTIGGGGGAGGFVTNASYAVEAGSNYTVVVGMGGPGAKGNAGTYATDGGTKGSNSLFGALTAFGGGGGGSYNQTANGASAGGSGGGMGAGRTGGPMAGTNGQGNAGGTTANNANGGAGGGGAGTVGTNGISAMNGAGAGGAGLSSAFSGTPTWYAGGGGGASRNQATYGAGGAGGLGGGGAGSTNAGLAGVANTGGGGGAGGFQGNVSYGGGTGGSGIVIVRYLFGVDNAGGATNVTATSAYLNGNLYADMPNATVFVFWGLADGGQDASAWANTNMWAASQSPGSFTFQATELASDSTWYYRYAVSNESGTGWADETAVFITGDVWIEKVSDASEIGPTPGTFTVHRASATTNATLIVNYTVGGTANNGTDYTALSGTVTIPAGETNAVLEIVPIFDHLLEGPETVVVTLAPGPYVIGSSSSDTVTIADQGIVTATWDGGGANVLASTAANWVEGEAPIAGDAIVLDAGTAKNMTWDLNIPVQSWTQDGYMGVVTIATFYPGQGAFTNFTILGDCVISNGVWTHTVNPAGNTEVRRLRASIGGDLIIGTNGAISAIGVGFAANSGPGAGTAPSYGGIGGSGYSGLPSTAPCYGSATSPTDLGSGGWYAGGGAVLLTVSGTIRNDGLICADGRSLDYVTGSGGSVWLIAGTLVGSGTIQANGGGITGHSPGGGGRIALVQTNAVDFSAYTGSVQAYKGRANTTYASGGTIYREKQGDLPGKGELIIDNGGGGVAYGAYAGISGVTEMTYEFSRITLTNSGVLAIGPNTTVIATNTIFAGDSATVNDGIAINGGALLVSDDFAYSNFFIRIGTTGSTFSPAVSLMIGTNAELRADQPHVMTTDVFVASGGKITHTANPAGSAEAYKLNLTLQGNLSVHAGGAVDVTGCGFPHSYGPGISPISCGGSYGGRGVSGGSCYGSLVAPTNLGSGGRGWGGWGGGAIKLTVSGVVSNGGRIFANTMEQTSRTGSGGSIYITAGALIGDGPIQANSAINVAGDSPGGGGRIALVVTNAGADFSGYLITNVTAFGGRKAVAGGAGTVYLRTAGQDIYDGTLIVDNDNMTGLGTEISSSVTDTTVANVLIKRKGYLLLATNQTLTVSGIWSNSAMFAGLTDSQVIFAGAPNSTSTIYGATTFKGLTCTQAGHTLAFAAESTNMVVAQGKLMLKGALGSKVFLRSTLDTTTWKLNVDPLAEQSVWDVDVKDSDANGGAEVTAINSVDSGNNPNWRFIAIGMGATNEWTGASNTVWSLRENWTLDRSPVGDDYIVIPAGKPRYPVLDATRMVNGIAIQSGGSVSLNGYDLTVTHAAMISGALTASGTELVTFLTDVNFTGGTFESARSSVVLAGSVPQSVNLADLTFYQVNVLNSEGTVAFGNGFTATELRCEAASGTRSLTFQQGYTVRLRDLVLLGSAASTNITLRSSSSGNPWKLAVSGYRSVRGVDVQDSDARVGLPISALSSKDSGNNTSWTFGVAPALWLGTSGNNFHTAANWDPAVVPDAATRVLVSGANPMTITGTVSILDLTVGGGVEVASAVTVNATLTVGESVLILDKGTLTWNKPGVVSNDLIVSAGGLLTHSANGSTEANKLDVTVFGNVGVDVNAAVDVTAKGYAGGKGPGTGNGACYGGRGDYAYIGSLCYGSITAPTNLGSGGAYNTCLGGGAIRLTVSGTIRHDGFMGAEGVNSDNNYYSPAGGSIFLSTGAMTGIGTIRANGGNTSGGQGVGGGGRIALVVTNANADFSTFTGPVMAYSGVMLPAATSAGRAGAGTVYRQIGADRPNRGTVTVANNNFTSSGYTEVPPYTNGILGEADRAVFHVANAATLKLTTNFTVGDIWLDTANAWLDLGSNTLTVNARQHPLGLVENVRNPGTIIWTGLPPGVLIIVR